MTGVLNRNNNNAEMQMMLGAGGEDGERLHAPPLNGGGVFRTA